MFDIKPPPDAVQRYGEKAATEFAKIKQTQTDLMNAFDLLVTHTQSVSDAAGIANSFEHLWKLLDAEHAQVLAAISAPSE